jgi:hypothetical protein
LLAKKVQAKPVSSQADTRPTFFSQTGTGQALSSPAGAYAWLPLALPCIKHLGMLHETNLGYEVQFIGRLDKASPSLIAEYHGDEAVLYIDTVLLFKLEIRAQLECCI